MVRIGTRRSPLALWQANCVQILLRHHCPGADVRIVPITTEADRRLDVPLAEVGGKGLFIKELEHALLDERIDIAVHSMKDVTVNIEPQFTIPAILERGNPYDALVSVKYDGLDDLPRNATVGTCSLRRQCQLLRVRPDFSIKPLRGNVQTRLKKLDNGEFDATVLAVSGLQRLEYENRITEILQGRSHIPSPGQGALGVECRSDDKKMIQLVSPMNHELSSIAVNCERAVNRELGGHCHVPIGIHGEIQNGQICISGFVGTADGKRLAEADAQGPVEDSSSVAGTLADRLKDLGAEEILNASQ